MHVDASAASEAHPAVWSLSLMLPDTHLHSLWLPFSVFLSCEVMISASVCSLSCPGQGVLYSAFTCAVSVVTLQDEK